MFDIKGNDDSRYNVDNIEFIKKASPIVGGLIEKEYNRQKNNVELIASENIVSEAVLAAMGMLKGILMFVPQETLAVITEERNL